MAKVRMEGEGKKVMRKESETEEEGHRWEGKGWENEGE